MAVEDLVTILVDYHQSEEERFATLYGAQALTAAQDMEELLERELRDQTGFSALWEDFQDDPPGTAEELTGILEAIIEADPGLGQNLDQLLGEFQTASREWAEEVEPGQGTPEAFSPGLPDQRAPEEPDPAQHRQGQEYQDKGAFRYGNQPPGEVSVEGRLARTPTPGEGEPRAEVELLFSQLRRTVEVRFDLNPAAREELDEIIKAMEAEFLREENPRRDRLRAYIEQICDLKPSLVPYLEDWLNDLENEEGRGGTTRTQ